MITVKSENGESKYKKWQWDLAWIIVWLSGVFFGAEMAYIVFR